MPDFKVLKSERLYAGKVFNLVVDHIEYSSGNRSIREVADHPGGAVAVPLRNNGDIILVRQLRYPINQMLYELPAGKLNTGEDPRECARRELEEETGYTSESWERLTAIHTTPGFCNELLHIYLAKNVRPSGKGQHLEEGELNLTVESVPFDKAVRMIEIGEITDSKTICGILLTERRLRNKTPL